MSLRRDWALVAMSVPLAAAIFLLRGPVSDGRFTVTVVPTDRSDLACSMSASAGPLHCGFDAGGRARSEGPHAERVLHPYVTTGGEVVLLAGVFEQRDVQTWSEASSSQASERVTLSCNAKLEGFTGQVRLRWKSGGRWDPFDALPIASIETCTLKR